MGAQGYESKETVVDHDSKSTVLIAKHSKFSSTKRTKYINIRYFYINDRIKAGDIKIQHCPTSEIVSDYFTKSLQGKQFFKLRNAVSGINRVQPSLVVQQECVGGHMF